MVVGRMGRGRVLHKLASETLVGVLHEGYKKISFTQYGGQNFFGATGHPPPPPRPLLALRAHLVAKGQ